MVKWTMAGAQIVRAPSSNSRARGNDVRKASAVAAAATGQLIVANSSRCAATNGPRSGRMPARTGDAGEQFRKDTRGRAPPRRRHPARTGREGGGATLE